MNYISTWNSSLFKATTSFWSAFVLIQLKDSDTLFIIMRFDLSLSDRNCKNCWSKRFISDVWWSEQFLSFATSTMTSFCACNPRKESCVVTGENSSPSNIVLIRISGQIWRLRSSGGDLMLPEISSADAIIKSRLRTSNCTALWIRCSLFLQFKISRCLHDHRWSERSRTSSIAPSDESMGQRRGKKVEECIFISSDLS